jgi:hypothetical protein
LDFGTVRFIQIDIHLLIARISLGSHDVLDVVKKRVEPFVHDQTSLLFGIVELLVLVLHGVR